MTALVSPTQAGFLQFVRNVMGIPTNILPDDADVIGFAYAVALDLVNPQLQAVPNRAASYPSIYALAVYNLAGDNLLNYAMDLPNADDYKNDLPFFQYMRQAFNINGFVGGVVQATADDSTSMSLVVPEQMKDLTFSNLQNLKTPWGRRYLGLAQSVGTDWGLS